MQIARSRETFLKPIWFLNTQHSYDKKYIELSESSESWSKYHERFPSRQILVAYGSERLYVITNEFLD